ncbi:MAG TPA: hypothetical protein VNX21_01945 [Candidatus Thermoplasmatota archaeon]|nr:hypothetical protein [Candidatus Thermoplasmatota archaeon]
MPDTVEDADRRLREVRDELAAAMVLLGLGHLTPAAYARRARHLKDERLGLEAARARLRGA